MHENIIAIHGVLKKFKKISKDNSKKILKKRRSQFWVKKGKKYVKKKKKQKRKKNPATVKNLCVLEYLLIFHRNICFVENFPHSFSLIFYFRGIGLEHKWISFCILSILGQGKKKITILNQSIFKIIKIKFKKTLKILNNM